MRRMLFDRIGSRALRNLVLTIVCFSASILNAQRTVWDGVYAEKQADAGASLYDEHCSRCHGDTLGASDAGPPLMGPDFRSNWDGLTLRALFERIRAMPSFRTQQRDRLLNANILAYLLRINGFPSGEFDLSSESDLLAGIKIVADPPK